MNEANRKIVVLLLSVSILTVFGGFFISQVSVGFSLGTLAAFIIAIVCFINPEIGLYILIISMLLGPQFGIDESTLAKSGGRGVTFRLDDILLIIIGASWFAKAAIRKDIGLFLKTPLNRPIAWYFIVCVISTTFGVMADRVPATTGFFYVLKYFEYFIVYFMAVNHLKDKKQIERFIMTILVVCLIVCIFCIWQLHEGGAGTRVSAPFEGKTGEPNTLGGYLLLMLSLVIGILLTDGMKRYRTFLFAVIPFIMFTLLATQSRGSWIALVPMIAGFLFFSRRKMAIMIPALLLIFFAPFILPKVVVDRALYTFNQPREADQLQLGDVRLDTSTSARLVTWKVVFTQDILKHALLGYGVTGYTFVDAQYPRVLIETGVLGMSMFLFLIFSILRVALRSYKISRDPLFQGICLGYLPGFFALLVHALAANTFIIVRIMEPFWFLTALVVMIPVLEKNKLLSPSIDIPASEQKNRIP